MMSSKARSFLITLAGAWVPAMLLAASGPPQKVAPAAPAVAKLSVSQILDKHVAARGGLQAWRGVTAMSWSGKMDVGYADSAARSAAYVRNSMLSGAARRKLVIQQSAEAQKEGNKQVQLPFLLEMKRPNKERVEIEFAGKTAVQVYDGSNGWMLRPYLNREDWEAFSPDQEKMQAAEPGIDGLLLDYAQRGTTVELDSVEAVQGSPAYKLKLTMKNGDVRHVWIDARTFLDVKIEGTPRRMDGRMRTVSVSQRDFRSVQGLTVPFVLETAIEGYSDTHKILIEKVTLNPKLDDMLFLKPKA